MRKDPCNEQTAQVHVSGPIGSSSGFSCARVHRHGRAHLHADTSHTGADMKNPCLRRMGLGVLIVMLAGCASYTPQPLSPADTAAAFETRTLADPGLKAFIGSNLKREVTPWPPTTWDLPLLTLAALYDNPELDVARAQWDVARAGEITAGARPNPTLAIGTQYNSSAVARVSPWTLGFTFNLQIETAGKRDYRIARAQNLSEAARFTITTAAWQVRARVRTALLKLHAADETLALLHKQLAAQETNLRLLTQGGALASLPNITQARIALDQTRLTAQDAQRQSAEARAQLAAAVGVPHAALDNIDFSYEVFEPLTLPKPPRAEELRRVALQNRPDILAALAHYAAAESALALEVAKQYPDIQLGPGYSWDQGDNKWSLGISFALPLFQRNQGPIAEASARRGEAAARFTALQARAIAEFETALAAYRAALAKLDTAETLREAQRLQYRTLRGMVRGEAGRFALINAELQSLAGERARLEAQIAAEQALGALEDAIEQPLHPLDLFPLTSQLLTSPLSARQEAR